MDKTVQEYLAEALSASKRESPYSALNILDNAVTAVVEGHYADALDAADAEIAREQESHGHTIDARDSFEDALSKAHVALGGNGEWTCKSYPTTPPETGDLRLDVPALATELRQQSITLQSRLSACVEALKEAADYLDVLEADMIGNDVDMMVDTKTSPSTVADKLRATVETTDVCP